ERGQGTDPTASAAWSRASPLFTSGKFTGSVLFLPGAVPAWFRCRSFAIRSNSSRALAPNPGSARKCQAVMQARLRQRPEHCRKPESLAAAPRSPAGQPGAAKGHPRNSVGFNPAQQKAPGQVKGPAGGLGVITP